MKFQIPRYKGYKVGIFRISPIFFMGCKATKTGVLMKWLVCASIYVLLFGVLNSNKIVLLAFFHIQITLWSLFDLQMYTYIQYNFHLEQL